MVFNDVSDELNEDLRKKSKLNIVVKRYFELLRIYGKEVMNEAKN